MLYLYLYLYCTCAPAQADDPIGGTAQCGARVAFQPSVPVMNQGGALDRAAKSDALIADVKCRAHVLNVIKCVFTNQRHDPS